LLTERYADHAVEKLFEWLRAFDQYPANVKRVCERVGGTGFFPGGSGLWNTTRGHLLPPMPVGGAMVLGHNLDSEETFARSVAQDGEDLNGATWRELIRLLPSVGVPLERCFFTNFFMGLVPGRMSTGPFPGARDPSFVAMCRAFLVEQLKAASPRLLIVMGMQTPRHLAALAPELRVWAPIRSFRDLDLSGTALVPRARVQGVEAPFTAVVITHACLARSNRRHRRYRGLYGPDAEMALLRDAVELSGLPSGSVQARW
jgi:hypothetical protein